MNTFIEELRHPDRNVRSRAILSLGKLGDARALDELLQQVGIETDFFVREDLTWALVRLREAAVQPLIDLLSDPNPSIRHHAAHTLSKIGDQRAMDALIRTLHDDDMEVVSKAVHALGQIGDVQAIPALIQLLGHENREVQSTVTTVVEGFGTPAVPLLIASLKHEQWQVREHAADILGVIGGEEVIPELIQAVDDAQWQVRFAAVAALNHLGAHKLLPPMQNEPDRRVQALLAKVTKKRA